MSDITTIQTKVLNYETRMYLIEMFTKDIGTPIDKLIDELFKRLVGIHGDGIKKDEKGWRKNFTKIIKSSRFDFRMGKLYPIPFPETQRPRCMFCSEKWSYWWADSNNRVRGIVKNKGDMCEHCQKLLTNECVSCFTKLEGVNWRTDKTFECSLCGKLNYRWYFCSTCTKPPDTLFCNAECKHKPTQSERTRTIPQHVQREVWRRDGGKCIECGSNERLEYDHIIPFSKGGSNTVRNIQLLCENCNRKKYNKI